MALRALGYWVSEADPGLPDPCSLVDAAWDVSEREWVADYLERGRVAAIAMGASRCRLCGCPNGTCDLSDGVYMWPQGLAHYVRGHAVRLPLEFIEHIDQQLQALGEIEVDDAWWRQNAHRT